MSADRRCRCCGDPCDVPNLTHCRACWEAECVPPLGCSKGLTEPASTSQVQP